MTRQPLLVIDDPLFDEHRSAGYHPERPERLVAARRAVATAATLGPTLRLEPRDASDDELARAHTAEHVESLAALAGHDAAVDADTYVGPRSIAAARRAAGGAIALVEALLDGHGGARRGVALLRPPGHHATPDQAMGFCLFNNVAVAAHAALAKGLERVAIVDWDVHHGNGTQDAFWRDPRVLFVSLHQFPLYPGTGASDEAGAGEGAGYTVNVPLSPSADDSVYEAATHELVVPLLEHFEPELVLVSAGYDAHVRDPLASMSLTDAAYATMARSIAAVAERTAAGRVALLLEGGYDLVAIEGSLEASLGALLEGDADRDGVEREASPARRGAAGRHRDEIDRARRVAARAWRGL